MRSNLKFARTAMAALNLSGIALVLSGCANTPYDKSRLRLADDFGVAVRQNIAAQIADPDAHYQGTVTPGTDGTIADVNGTRYLLHGVPQPGAQSTR